MRNKQYQQIVPIKMRIRMHQNKDTKNKQDDLDAECKIMI